MSYLRMVLSRSQSAAISTFAVLVIKTMVAFIAAIVPAFLSAAETNLVTHVYIAQALQGDISQANQLFGSLTPQSGSDLDHYLAEQYRHRFVLRDENSNPDSGNNFIDELVAIYRQYWTQILTEEKSPDESMVWLKSALNDLLVNNAEVDIPGSLADVFIRLDHAIEQQGFYSDRSYASPLHDLMLWKMQQTESYVVELTDQSQEVTVIFMDDFYSMGWSDFATLGMTSTGGWAAKDVLYCVSWAWDPSSENFRVSYLQHEARHLADYRRFPQLQAIDLEYRAKLTELSFASSSLPRLLNKFTVNGAANTDSPHAFANYRVSRDLYQAIFGSPLPETGNPWLRIGADKVNPAARALLEEHTRKLVSLTELPGS